MPENKPLIFLPAWDSCNQPPKIVALGHYYPKPKVAAAKSLVKEVRPQYGTDEIEARVVRDNLAWTRLLDALSSERKWPVKRLYAQLNPMLAPGIALAVVPPHRAFQAFWPLRTLAQMLAAEEGRIDATSCLVRHTTIRRILYGGPSTRALHRRTIRVEDGALLEGRSVLLLDDIAKSGASLVACREMLTEAGAGTVQALALGRVIVEIQRF